MGIAAERQGSVGIEPAGLLPSGLAAELLTRTRRLRVKQGQIVIAEGSASDEVFYILEGKLQVSMLSIGGWETIFRVMGPGELLGELAAIDGDLRSASVVAVEDTVLASIGAAQFRQFLAEVPQAGYWMARQLTERIRDLSARAFEMATLPVIGRLIAELLRLPAKVGAGENARTVLALPTHAELAARIGTHRESVTRELRKLTKLGFVLQEGRAMRIQAVDRLTTMLHDMRR